MEFIVREIKSALFLVLMMVISTHCFAADTSIGASAEFVYVKNFENAMVSVAASGAEAATETIAFETETGTGEDGKIKIVVIQ